jgi:Domain of unknown function (DUF4390)
MTEGFHGRMRLTALACLAAASLAAVALVYPSGEVKVTPVVASDGRLLVSFAAPAAFTEDARTVIKSGLTLTFTYVVELRRPAMWFDGTLGQITVAAQAKLDNLTRDYQVSKLRQGQVVKSDKVDQESQVREWLTQFDSVLLEPSTPLVVNGDYYVRVRLRAEPRSSFSLWPFRGDDATGRADFTFIR